MWWDIYQIIEEFGPMSKEDILRKMNLKTTSYVTLFSDLSACNIIVRKNKKLYTMPNNKWCKNIF